MWSKCLNLVFKIYWWYLSQKKQLIHSIVKQFIGALWCFSYFSSTYQFLSGYDFSLLYEAVLSNTFKCFCWFLGHPPQHFTLALAPHGTLVNIQNWHSWHKALSEHLASSSTLIEAFLWCHKQMSDPLFLVYLMIFGQRAYLANRSMAVSSWADKEIVPAFVTLIKCQSNQQADACPILLCRHEAREACTLFIEWGNQGHNYSMLTPQQFGGISYFMYLGATITTSCISLKLNSL